MRFRIKWLQIEPERIPVVLKEINYGSEPAARFYALVATSTLIAAFGLIANSVAVIIGAMVVAPLMTPIFGMALALVRGNAKLLGRALQAETLGVILAIGVSAIFGSLPLALEVTPEMLARTQPTLLDMLVAVLAGFAGAYATIDEHLSPALPGVAIAVAVVPPLANAGLCLAVGAYLGMYGSMLLFLANLLSILLVSTVVFIASGLAKQIELENTRELFRRFGVACVGFIIVSVLLTHALIRIVQERYLTNTIEKVMSAELAHIPTSALEDIIHQTYQGKLYILATMRSPKVISPNQVKHIQENLNKKLHLPTELIVRSILAKDISATGSTSQVTARNLNRLFLTGKLSPDILTIQLAEQSLRETLASRPELNLMDVELVHFPSGPVILTTIQGSRVLIPFEVKKIEEAMQKRLQNPNIRLLVRCLTTVEVDAQGRILYGAAHFGVETPPEKALREKVENAVKEEFKQLPDVFLTNVDAIKRDGVWHVRVEAVGARVATTRNVRELEKAVSRKTDQTVKIFLWFRPEVMVTAEGYTSAEDYTEKRLMEQEKALEKSGASQGIKVNPPP
ncbi:MAG: DUF389 domain-containing protein [Syntrophales bacterium]|nr:DUF389 domain-containing protein [Syntrophales bacterium]